MTIRALALAAAALVSATTLANAAPYNTFSFTGTLAQDNSKAVFNFGAASAGFNATLTSFGYGGGTNAAGMTFAAGGFDTIISVYDSEGKLVIDNDDGFSGNIDPTTGARADSQVVWFFQPGNYRAIVTQYNNFGPILLSDGFAFDGQPNFAGGFIDSYGSQRTNFFALDITGAARGSDPQAGTLGVFAGGLGLLGLAMRRRAR